MGDNLKDKMIGALTWSSVNIFGGQFIQLLVGIILARILIPEEFGQIGVLYIFIGLSTVLIDGGFGQAIIRKQDANKKDLSTIFYLNIITSVSLYIILYFSAPYIASFFNQPAITDLSRVVFISVLIFPLYFLHQVQLLKNLDYKSLAIINIISTGLSGIFAAILAIKGFGIWSLVFQQLSFHFFKLVAFPFFIRWKPSLTFSISTIRELSGFSLPLLGQIILNVIFNHIYTVIIGRFYPIKQVGYFTQANKYSETVNAATQSILSSGTFPTFAKIQGDQPRLLRIYRKLTTSVSMITFPLISFLFIAAEPIIITLISEKWIESIVLFQILLAANLFTPLFTINVNILNARGESANTFKLEIIRKTFILISIIGLFGFGIKEMLLGFLIANYISYFVSMYFIKKSLTHYYHHQIMDMSKILILIFFTGGICFLLNFIDACFIVKLILMLMSYITIYVFAIYIFHKEFTTEIHVQLKKIINKLKK